MAFCANCGAEIAPGANNCMKCGKPSGQSMGGGAAAAPAPTATAGGLQDNVAGMLAYITIIPAIIFLVVEPYNRSRFVRFHAFQCIFLAVGLTAIHIALLFIPIIGWAISGLVSLAALALWIVCLLKAYQNQMWKVPVIGDLAEKQAGI
jgi:uncharacterized membrane protein